MINLVLALIFSLTIMVIFKVMSKYNTNIIHVITTNYLIAFVLGYFFVKQFFDFQYILKQDWFYYAFITGASFFLVFNVFAISAHKVGIALTSISSKMSVIIPVLLGGLIFNEQLSVVKMLGVALAMFSFYLILKKNDSFKYNSFLLVLPLLLFIGNGINDSIMKFVQFNFLKEFHDLTLFLTVVFFTAFILGFFTTSFNFLKKQRKFNINSFYFGIFLGVCNWFSTLFFIRGLEKIDVSVFIPVFNAGLVSIAAIIGLKFFKEILSKTNIIGIVISIVAITIIALSK